MRRPEAGHIFKAMIFVAPMLVVHPGDADAFGLGVRFTKPDQALGGGVGQRSQQDRIHHAEDGGVRADAQRQSQNHDQRKTGESPDAPQTVAQILRDTFKRWEAPGIHGAFLDPGEVADVAARRRAGLIGGQAARDVLLDFKFQVGIDLGAEVAGQAVAVSEGAAEFGPIFAQHVQPSGARMRPMASTKRCQRDVAATSCLRPAGVSR